MFPSLQMIDKRLPQLLHVIPGFVGDDVNVALRRDFALTIEMMSVMDRAWERMTYAPTGLIA